MDSLGMNNDLTVGGRKFHVQTSYSESTNEINSQVFNEGVVISSRQIRLDSDRPREQIKERMEEIHQELTTEMEILYYICEKVKTVRHAASANKLGILFLQKNLIPEAIEQFNLALEIDPDYSEVYANLGKTFLMADSYDKAIRVLKKGVQQAAYFADLQNYLGVAHLYSKNYEDSAHHLGEAVRLNPDYIGAHYHLGVANLAISVAENQANAEEFQKKGLEYLKIASDRMVNRQIPNFNKVMDLAGKQLFQEAVDEFFLVKPKKMLSQFLTIENEFYLKFMYGGKGKDDSFISDYVEQLRALLDLNPEYADIRNNLGVANLIQCRNLFLKALDEFRAALRINPGFKKAEKNLKLAENDGKGFLILLRAVLK